MCSGNTDAFDLPCAFSNTIVSNRKIFFAVSDHDNHNKIHFVELHDARTDNNWSTRSDTLTQVCDSRVNFNESFQQYRLEKPNQTIRRVSMVIHQWFHDPYTFRKQFEFIVERLCFRRIRIFPEFYRACFGRSCIINSFLRLSMSRRKYFPDIISSVRRK